MLKLLFIDDEPDSLEPLKRHLGQHLDFKEVTCDFPQARDRIAGYRPDIVILDLADAANPEDPQAEARDTLDLLWKGHFCPIVVYAANPDLLEDHRDHPFVVRVQKGARSPQKVLAEIKEFEPHITALKDAEKSVRRSFSEAMRDLAPVALGATGKVNADIIKRAGRRWLAALMDEPATDGKTPAAWEQYLFPPVSKDILLGDVLKKKEADRMEPVAYRIVLTPSCDMVKSGERIPKVREVLVAICCSMRQALKHTGRAGIGRAKILKDLRNDMLTPGYMSPAIPFPQLNGRIPLMAANLRQLELIPFDELNDDYERIASIDSPFREMIAWAYLQTAGRPGLPERDTAKWAKEIADEMDAHRG